MTRCTLAARAARDPLTNAWRWGTMYYVAHEAGSAGRPRRREAMAHAAATPSPHHLAADPAYLAHALGTYQQAEHLSDRALAAELGIAVEQLDRLRRCKLPAVDAYAVRLYRTVA